uniref:transposase n=1 Tax=Limnoglobus roseus TaxID=2598579 RepID=UPI0011EB0432
MPSARRPAARPAPGRPRSAGACHTPASGDTILRRVAGGTVEPEPAYRWVGIDDFALRKGHVYGTILIGLERSRVVDLFDGRDGAAVRAWLRAHPGIEVVTLDRGSAYAKAAGAAAPWHLLKNLREAVERLFERYAAAVRAALTPARRRPFRPRRRTRSGPASRSRRHPRRPTPRVGRRGSRTTAGRTNCTARGTRTGRSPGTCGCPAPSPAGTCGPRSTPTGGPGECTRRGRTGSPPTSSTAGWPRRGSGGCGRTPPLRLLRPAVGAAVVVRVPPPAERSAGERDRLARRRRPAGRPRPGREVRRDGPSVILCPAKRLAGPGGRLEVRGTPRVRRRRLRSDEPAVAAALTEAWSNRPVEGQVNRLKTIKRQTYGRAGLPLLRARVRAKP